ncbi:MAG: hypothetical protein IKV45_03625 [Firmicutes bacterium]|nr:hypothetical protein [Bacillota bacterium]
MHTDEVRNLDELNELYWKNRNLLGEEEQRLFQAILLELQKGEYGDRQVLEQYITELAKRKNLI